MLRRRATRLFVALRVARTALSGPNTAIERSWRLVSRFPLPGILQKFKSRASSRHIFYLAIPSIGPASRAEVPASKVISRIIRRCCDTFHYKFGGSESMRAWLMFLLKGMTIFILPLTRGKVVVPRRSFFRHRWLQISPLSRGCGLTHALVTKCLRALNKLTEGNPSRKHI